MYKLHVQLDPLRSDGATPREARPRERWHEDYGDTVLVYEKGRCVDEVQKEHANTELLVEPWLCTEWTGIVDFKDVTSQAIKNLRSHFLVLRLIVCDSSSTASAIRSITSAAMLVMMWSGAL